MLGGERFARAPATRADAIASAASQAIRPEPRRARDAAIAPSREGVVISSAALAAAAAPTPPLPRAADTPGELHDEAPKGQSGNRPAAKARAGGRRA
jgi:hypothetical protein